jgi:hypothetical protein
MRTKAIKPTTIGSIYLGTQFVYRTVEILGRECSDTRKPSFEGQILTVVGFKPHYVNQIVARDPGGYEILLPLSTVERVVKLQARQIDIDESGSDGICPQKSASRQDVALPAHNYARES